jgi:hypothetical protein
MKSGFKIAIGVVVGWVAACVFWALLESVPFLHNLSDRDPNLTVRLEAVAFHAIGAFLGFGLLMFVVAMIVRPHLK